MEDGVPSFPLFQLPNGPLKCVLQNMHMIHQVALSILSKRCKKHVKSLNVRVCEIRVYISEVISIAVQRPRGPLLGWSFYTDQLRKDNIEGRDPLTTKMYSPEFIIAYTGEGNQSYEWKKPGFEIKDWIDHFISIFNYTKVDKLWFCGRTQFDIEPLQKAIKELIEIRIDDNYPAAYIQQVVQTNPTVKRLYLYLSTTSNLESYHNIFCQRFDDLTLIASMEHRPPKWNLDDLLLMNSRSIELHNSNLTEKDFNLFLKQWMNGSNPRMEHLNIGFRRNIKQNKEILLRGLNYQIAPSDRERCFKRPVKYLDGSLTIIVKGGYDIKREDGTTGTIIIHQDQEEEQHQYFDFTFVVWH